MSEDLMSSERFAEAWKLWVQHRKEIRKKLTPTTERLQLKKLVQWGEEVAIRSIYQSIENGWQGLFYPKEQPQPSKPAAETPNSDNAVPQISEEQRKENLRKLGQIMREIKCQKSLQ